MRPQPNRPWATRRNTGGQPPVPGWMVGAGAALAVCLLLGMLALGWKAVSSAGPTTPARGFRLLVDCDISGSMTTAEKKANLGVVESVFTRVLPADAHFDFWAFSQDCWEIYSGKPQVVRELWPMLDRVQGSRAERAGSSPRQALERNLQEARKARERGEDVAIMLLWDGEDTDPAATERVVRELAALPNLEAVWILGLPVEPGRGSDPRARAGRSFASLGDRLVASGQYDVKVGLDRFREVVAQGR